MESRLAGGEVPGTGVAAGGRAGEARAREEVLALLRPRLLALAKRRVGEEEAPDLVQETLMVLDRHLVEHTGAEHTEPEPLLAFAHGVLRNKIGNFYRKRDRRHLWDGELPAGQEPAVEIAGELAASELEKVLVAAIRRLGESRPLCAQLFDGLRRGRELAAIGAGLGLSRAQLDDRLYRCRQALRRVVEVDLGFPL